MPSTVESVVIILLVVYGLITTYLVYDYYRNQENYMKDKVDYINSKTSELLMRERNVSGREACDRELIKLKTIHKSIYDILSSYNNQISPII